MGVYIRSKFRCPKMSRTETEKEEKRCNRGDFQSKTINIVQEQWIITQDLTDMVMTWNDNCGFNVHTNSINHFNSG